MKKSAIKTMLIGAILGTIIGASIGAGFCLMTHGFLPERNEDITGMTVFLLVEATVGCFLGALFWRTVQSRQRDATRFQKAVLRGKVLISVAPQTGEDAVDTAREWKKIGDHLLQH
ncbi:MAG TPA: hypothetical protein VID27_10515 [Blastocatellia bacterium]|jgi:hypothetical protein